MPSSQNSELPGCGSPLSSRWRNCAVLEAVEDLAEAVAHVVGLALELGEPAAVHELGDDHALAEEVADDVGDADVRVAAVLARHRAVVGGLELVVELLRDALGDLLRDLLGREAWGDPGADLKNVGLLLKAGARIAPGLATKEVAQEITERITEELDYKLEAANHRAMAREYRGHPYIRVPDVVGDLCRERVIVTEFVHGRRFAELKGEPDDVRDRFGEILYRFYVNGPFRHLLLNGDPHPGNSLFCDDGRSRPDFGFFKRQSAGSVDVQRRLLQAVYEQDADKLYAISTEQGVIRDNPELVGPLMQKYHAATWWFMRDEPVKLKASDVTTIVLEHADMRGSDFGELRLPADQVRRCGRSASCSGSSAARGDQQLAPDRARGPLRRRAADRARARRGRVAQRGTGMSVAEETDVVRIERTAGVERIELHRPDALNAFDGRLGPALRDALLRAAEDPEVRTVLLTGAGRAFSVGADLKAERPRTPEGKPDLARTLREIYNPAILAIRRMPKPVIAAVNGPAVGVGCSIAMAADLVLAGESAVFAFGFSNIGLAPDGGASAFLPARLGHARALEIALLGDRLDAARALEWGLVNAVHPDAELRGAAEALAARLAAGAPLSFASAKELVNRTLYPDLEAQLAAEAEAQGRHGASADFAEGVIAFLQKRQPRFVGA